MLHVSDFIQLPFTADLTQAGLVYACRSLQFTYNRMGGSQGDRLRRIVAGKAVELAFRRYLTAQKIPFDSFGATPFTDPDHYDVALGGRRCDLKSYLILEKNKIRQLRRDPAALLEAAALVPVDQAQSEHWGDQDLYIFAFTTALIAARPAELEKARAAGQPTFLIHTLPAAWSQHYPWKSLGKLVLKSEGSEVVRIEVGGQGHDRQFQTEQLDLLPGTRVQIASDFYSLAYLHISTPDHGLPSGRLGLHSAALGQTQVVHRPEWQNIWVYGMEIILAGYITRGDYRQLAADLPAGSPVWQYPRTRTPNLNMFVQELRPLRTLLGQAREYYAQKTEESGKTS